MEAYERAETAMLVDAMNGDMDRVRRAASAMDAGQREAYSRQLIAVNNALRTAHYDTEGKRHG